MESIWDTLPRPVLALAPMADVTDTAFRRVIARYGKPDVMWTEFVSADGLHYTREIQRMRDDENPLMLDLRYTEEERPIIAQLFTAKPETLRYAAALVAHLGFDGVDINMGCPDRSIERQGAGAALLKEPTLMAELVEAAHNGVRDASRQIPVSVKTRIGYRSNELEHFLPVLFAAAPALVTIHARTRSELSKVPAHWEYVREAVALRNVQHNNILILGNGDVEDIPDAKRKVTQTGADGAMLGRAIFGNPWLWSGHVPDHKEKFSVLIEHARLFEESVPHKSFAVMKKHIKAYIEGFDGAKELRAALMRCSSAADMASVVEAHHG